MFYGVTFLPEKFITLPTPANMKGIYYVYHP